MNLQNLEPGFAIADALSPEDLEEVSRQGFRTVICNRRPGESEDHPDERALSTEAERLGLKWVSIPVASGEYSEADVAAFRQTLEEAPTPILAFCRSGRRSTHLWAQARAQQPQCNIPMLLKAAREAGQDPQPIRKLLQTASEQVTDPDTR